VEVKHHVAIDINEEVSSALLSVNEPMNLESLVDVVALSRLKSCLVLGSRECSLN